MKHLVYLLIFLILTPGCAYFKFGWQRGDKQPAPEGGQNIEGLDGPSNGHFNDDGEWVPDDPTIAATYQIPDISSGFIIDIGSALSDEERRRGEFLSPSLQIELIEFDTQIPYVRTLKVDLGAAYQRPFIYLGKKWTSIFEVSTGVFAGWNFDTNELSYGVGATIIKF